MEYNMDYKKRNLLDAVKKLLEFTEYYLESWYGFSEKEKLDLLTNCQQITIQLGNYIEKQYIGVQTIVQELENYCEKLYMISKQKNRDYVVALDNEAQAILNKVMREIDKKIPDDKLRVAFFPYKYSMWDSMESIWKSANESDDCECAVIPIPYYDVKVKKVLGEMHWEGDKFPKEIPIVKWDDIDNLKGIDIAFIHNPFDDNNVITMTHPQFFSYNLKKYVKTLVYVPYFITDRYLPETHLYLPAYENMDYIVVQNALCKKQLVSRYGEKILDLGSPKIDRLLEIDAKGCSIQKLNEFVDGKRAILVNISISSVLKYGERVIEKIKKCINELYLHSNIVVIWRPHPLLEITIKTMRPELWETYIELKRTIELNDRVFYDNGLDLDQVIAASDAYMGEKSSSIVMLYACVGKPVFIFDYENVISEKKLIGFFDCIVKNDKIIFVHNKTGILCTGNLRTGEIEKVKFLQDECDSGRWYGDIGETDDEYYFAPMNSRKMIRYKKENEAIKYEEFPDMHAANFNRALKYKEKLFLIPVTYEAIIQVDTVSGEKEFVEEPINLIKKMRYCDGYYSMFGSCIVGDCLYIVSPICNYIIEYNIICKTTKAYEIIADNMGYWDMVYDGNDFWLNPYKGNKIVRWNKEEGTVKQIYKYPKELMLPVNNQDCFMRFVYTSGCVWAFPKKANRILKINTENNGIESVKLEKNIMKELDENNPKWGSKFYFVKVNNGIIYAMLSDSRILLTIDPITNKVDQFTFKMSQNQMEKVKKEVFEGNLLTNDDCFIEECDLIDSIDFVKLLSNCEMNCNEKEAKRCREKFTNADGTAGEKIFHFIKGELTNGG